MANDVVITIRGVDRASGELQDAERTIDRISDAARRSHGPLGGLGSRLGTLTNVLKVGVVAGAAAGTAAIAGLGVAAVKMGADFEKGFSEVTTLLPQLNADQIDDLRKKTLAFSKDMGIATDQVIPAMYQAISAGVAPDNLFTFMTTAVKTSVGGATDLETAVDGITSAVNAYGSANLSASQASDLMFSAVRLGKTTIADLSASMFQVLPTASSLGVQFDEITAALATMTLQGVPTSVATTQLRQALVEASKGGTKLDEAIRSLTGKGFGDLTKEGRTAQSIFEELRGSMPEQEFKDLFGSVEAMNAALQITGPNSATFVSSLDQMKQAGGATDAAFKVMSDTFQFQLNKAINEIKVTLMEIGLVVLPYLTEALKGTMEFIHGFMYALREGDVTSGGVFGAGEKIGLLFKEDVIPVLEQVRDIVSQQLSQAWAQLQQTLEGLLPVVAEVLQFFKDHPAAIAILVVGLAALFAILFPIPAAIIAITAAGTLLLANWDAIRDKATELYNKIAEMPVIGAIFTGAIEAIGIYVETTFTNIKIIIETTLDAILNAFQFWIAIFRGDWDRAWDELKQFYEGIWNGIVGVVGNSLEGIKNLLWTYIQTWIGVLSDAGPLMASAGFALLESLRQGIMDLWNNHLWPFIVNLPQTWLNTFTGFYGQMFTAGAELLDRLWQGIKSGIWKIDDVVGDIIGKLNPLNWDFPGRSPFREAFMHTGEDIPNLISAGIQNQLYSLESAIKVIRLKLNETLDESTRTELQRQLAILLEEYDAIINGWTPPVPGGGGGGGGGGVDAGIIGNPSASSGELPPVTAGDVLVRNSWLWGSGERRTALWRAVGSALGLGSASDLAGMAVGALVDALNHSASAIQSGANAFLSLGAGGEGVLNFLRQNGLSFATGGRVPGPIGAPRVILAHGGEEVVPNGAGGSLTININAIDGESVRRIAPQLAQYIQTYVRGAGGTGLIV